MAPVQHPLYSESLLGVTLEAALDEILGRLGHLAPLSCRRGRVQGGVKSKSKTTMSRRGQTQRPIKLHESGS